MIDMFPLIKRVRARLLRLPFVPEDGGPTFIRNVSELLPHYATSYPRAFTVTELRIQLKYVYVFKSARRCAPQCAPGGAQHTDKRSLACGCIGPDPGGVVYLSGVQTRRKTVKTTKRENTHPWVELRTQKQICRE